MSEPEREPSDLLYIWEAAYRLRCSERTVKRLCEAGELCSAGRGRLRRIEYSSIVEYIARHRNPPKKKAA